MLYFLPKIFRSLLAILLYTLSFIICGIYVYSLAPFKFFLPVRKWRRAVVRLYRHIPIFWSRTSDFILWLTSKTKWEIRIDPKVNTKESTILIANHQSWFDIIAIQKAIAGIAAPPVYFMKSQLLWVPVLGLGCWLMDFPFMKRYSKAYLAKHPEKRGRDIETTRRTCERYKNSHVTLVSFAEGTRFRSAKHSTQGSPYQHLLKPRGGGIAFSLLAMGEQVKHFLNATVVYLPSPASMWDLLAGSAKKIIVQIDLVDIPHDMRGDYQNDPAYRERFQNWLNKLWEEKDTLIERLKMKDEA